MDNLLKIINHLGKNKDKQFTMHELSKLANIPYATFYRTIQKMQEIVEVKTVGKAKTIQLKTTPLAKPYLTISSHEEKNSFLKQHPILNKITKELNTNDVVLLFGSYAKGKATEKSDIDLLIINKKGEKSTSFEKYELLFNKTINPLFITEKEFREMIEEKKENVGKQALKDHIILNNPERFWELTLGD